MDENTIEHLVANVKKTYNNYPKGDISNVWGLQVSCWREIIEDKGGNQYTKPNTGDTIRTQKFLSSIDHTIDVELYNKLASLVL